MSNSVQYLTSCCRDNITSCLVSGGIVIGVGCSSSHKHSLNCDGPCLVQLAAAIQPSWLPPSSPVSCRHPAQSAAAIQPSRLPPSSPVSCRHPAQLAAAIQPSQLPPSSPVGCRHPAQSAAAIQPSWLPPSSPVGCRHPAQFHMLRFELGPTHYRDGLS